MYSRKIPDSHRLIGGRSHVFYFDFKSLGTWLFGTTVKVFGTSHTSGWIWYYIPGIQRSRTPFVFEICVIPLKPVLNTGSDESWHTLCVQLLNVCLCLPLHTHSRGQCPNARSLSVYLSPFFPMFFQYFFIGCDRPWNVHCWRSSCLDLVTAHAIIPQLTSDPILNTHQISSWSPPTLLYHNWYQVSAPTLLYHNWYQVSDPVSHTHQMPRVA